MVFFNVNKSKYIKIYPIIVCFWVEVFEKFL
jgi:hypothetical protein